jgi:hypothetical protein
LKSLFESSFTRLKSLPMRRRNVLGLIAATSAIATGAVWIQRDIQPNRSFSTSSLASETLTTAGAIAVATLGDLQLMHDATAGSICLQRADGTETWRLPETGHPFVRAAAASSARGRIWVVDASSRSVRSFDSLGNELAVVHRGAVAGLVWDEQREWLFVSAPTARQVVAYNLSGDVMQQIEVSRDSVLRYPGALAIGSDATLYVTDRESGGIVCVDAQGRVTGELPNGDGRLFHSLVVQGGLLHAADRETATVSTWSANGSLLEARALRDAEGLPATPWALGLPVAGYPSVQTDRPARMEQA